jgi:hypothetical protein
MARLSRIVGFKVFIAVRTPLAWGLQKVSKKEWFFSENSVVIFGQVNGYAVFLCQRSSDSRRSLKIAIGK